MQSDRDRRRKKQTTKGSAKEGKKRREAKTRGELGKKNFSQDELTRKKSSEFQGGVRAPNHEHPDRCVKKSRELLASICRVYVQTRRSARAPPWIHAENLHACTPHE